MMTLEPVIERHLAIQWTVSYLGIPEGFDKCTYRGWVNRLMDSADYEEWYLVDDLGSPQAYFAFCISEDIHHRGDIFDVTNVVIKPNAPPAVNKLLMRTIYNMAKAYKCQWVSRCVHETDGSIRNVFKRV